MKIPRSNDYILAFMHHEDYTSCYPHRPLADIRGTFEWAWMETGEDPSLPYESLPYTPMIHERYDWGEH